MVTFHESAHSSPSGHTRTHKHMQTHRHTHKHAHTPIQFAALWQAFSAALRDSKSITNAACPVVGWPNSSALLKISPFGRCPASHAKAHVALTAHLLIHTYTHTCTCAWPHSGCCMPLATKKSAKRHVATGLPQPN